MTAPNSYFGYMGTLYFCVTCNKKFNSEHIFKFQLSVRVREPCLWTAAQFPNSERVSLKQRMIFRAGQLAGRGLVMAFVNWGAASSCLEPGLSSKTGSKPRDTEHRGPSAAAQMMMVSMTNILRTWIWCYLKPHPGWVPFQIFIQFWFLPPPQTSLALWTSRRLCKKGRRGHSYPPPPF